MNPGTKLTKAQRDKLVTPATAPPAKRKAVVDSATSKVTAGAKIIFTSETRDNPWIDVTLTTRDIEILRMHQDKIANKTIAEHFDLSEARALNLRREATKRIIRAFLEAQP